MKNLTQTKQKETISAILNYLSEKCLMFDNYTQENKNIPPEFSDRDVMNVILTFSTILGNRSTHKMYNGKIPLEYSLELAEEFGEEIHKLALKMSGVNTKFFYKDYKIK